MTNEVIQKMVLFTPLTNCSSLARLTRSLMKNMTNMAVTKANPKPVLNAIWKPRLLPAPSCEIYGDGKRF